MPGKVTSLRQLTTEIVMLSEVIADLLALHRSCQTIASPDSVSAVVKLHLEIHSFDPVRHSALARLPIVAMRPAG